MALLTVMREAEPYDVRIISRRACRQQRVTSCCVTTQQQLCHNLLKRRELGVLRCLEEQSIAFDPMLLSVYNSIILLINFMRLRLAYKTTHWQSYHLGCCIVFVKMLLVTCSTGHEQSVELKVLSI